ncbi:unnamed protein product [Sphacelaria rigidula]
MQRGTWPVNHHDYCKRHWRGVMKDLVYLHTTINYGLTFSSGESVLSVYCDADYAKKETQRRSVSGVAVVDVQIPMRSSKHAVLSRTTLSTTEAEYVAMAEGAKECMFVRVVVGRHVEYDIVFHKDNEGAKALADNPISSDPSKHIDVRRWHFMRDLVRTGAVRVVHVDSE